MPVHTNDVQKLFKFSIVLDNVSERNIIDETCVELCNRCFVWIAGAGRRGNVSSIDKAPDDTVFLEWQYSRVEIEISLNTMKL